MMLLRGGLRAAQRRGAASAASFQLGFGTVDFDVGMIAKGGYYAYGKDEEAKGLARDRTRAGRMIPESEMPTLLHGLLKDYWGFEHFKNGQYEVMEKLLSGEDVVATMPTGHGKSLLYQLPPLAIGKPVLVISPLIALMEEQVTSLKQRGISAAYSGRGDAFQQDWDSLDILFMSPESVAKQIARIAHTDLGFVAVDEAHCVSEWGIQFRPPYRELGVLRETHPHIPILAITASATPNVVDDIRTVLCMREPAHITHSFNRPNIHYTIAPKNVKTRETVRDIVASEPCSIIYCMTIKQCTSLHDYLIKQGVNAALYHGDMDMPSRMTNQRAFMREDVSCIVCTVAFGMGIDKPNVRHVIHFGHCKSLTDYYQQTGRAGRDGARSRCTMFVSLPDVVNKSSFLLNGLSPRHAGATLADISALIEYCELDRSTCRRVPLLSHFSENYRPSKEGCGACDNCDTKHATGLAGKQVDITVIGNQLLRLVHGIKFATSKEKIVVTFLGKGGYTLNRMYNMGTQYTKRHVEAVLDQLRVEGYLQRTLKKMEKMDKTRLWLGWELTEKGRELIFDHNYMHHNEIRVKPVTSLLESMKEYRNLPQAIREEQYAEDKKLFMKVLGGEEYLGLWEELTALRKARSDELDISPQHYISDGALISMVHVRPSTQKVFTEHVKNVSKNFDGTPDFVNCIAAHCRKLRLKTDVCVRKQTGRPFSHLAKKKNVKK